VAATEQRSGALRALTAAALALPGIVPAHADVLDTGKIAIAYQHYAEGKRDLGEQTYAELNLRPLQADSVAISLSGSAFDRIEFGLELTQDTWSGATPVTTLPQAAVADQIMSGASVPSVYYTTGKGTPVDVDWSTYNGTTVSSVRDIRDVHVMGSASPETRRQASGDVAYAFDTVTLGVGGGVSEEPDYHSKFVNGRAAWDLNQKLTTLSGSFSYTHSSISASLEANAAADWGAYLNDIKLVKGVSTLFGARTDVAGSVGLAQVLSKNALLSTSVSFTQSRGYLSNPYKATVLAFDDPAQFIDSTGLRTVVVKGTLEQRPHERAQWAWDTRYVQHIDALDAALHLDYRLYHDDWSITAHTLDAQWYQSLGSGWTLTPGVRYYSQTAALFYKPFFYFRQAFPILLPRNPELPPKLDHSQIRIANFSSDERLSGFGTLSESLALSHPFLNFATLEIGAEYARQAGSLKLGGRGEGRYADFNSLSGYLTLNFDLAATVAADDGGAADDGSPASHTRDVPVDVQPLLAAGHSAIRLRHTMTDSDGRIRLDGAPVHDRRIVRHGCAPSVCYRVPAKDSEAVTEIDAAYAPLDWLTLSLSPSFVDKREVQRPLKGAPFPPFFPLPGASAPPFNHTTGGLGDTDVAATARIAGVGPLQVQAQLGISIPTGSVGRRVGKGNAYEDYGLQLGSGTFDAKPGLTLIADLDPWTIGAQAASTIRLQSHNISGYALGNAFDAEMWSAYRVTDWFGALVRGVYTSEGRITGSFKPHLEPLQTGVTLVGGMPVPTYEFDSVAQPVLGPEDVARSTGGHCFELGIGATISETSGPLQGNSFSIEWLQPVWQKAYGYQLAERGELTVSWQVQL
jgi:hypothetical protein